MGRDRSWHWITPRYVLFGLSPWKYLWHDYETHKWKCLTHFFSLKECIVDVWLPLKMFDIPIGYFTLQWRIQDFPEGGAWTLQGGREHAKFSRKLHEIERIWTPRGGACVPHAPPRSANALETGKFGNLRHFFSENENASYTWSKSKNWCYGDIVWQDISPINCKSSSIFYSIVIYCQWSH